MTTRDSVARFEAAKAAAGVDGEAKRAKAQTRLLEIIGILGELLVDGGLVEKLEFTSKGQIISRRGGLDGLSEEGSRETMERLAGELMGLVNQGAEIPPQYVIGARELGEIAGRDLS